MLIDKRELARELKISTRKVDQMRSAGLLPMPRRLGRSVRWVEAEITEWVRLGCLPRERFDMMKRTGVEL